MNRRKIGSPLCCSCLAAFLAGAAACLLPATTAMGQSASAEELRLARQSSFIFRGRVEKIAASNVKLLSSTERTTEVRVLEVLQATPAISVAKGDALTVLLLNPNSVKPGEQAVFYTNGWLYGEHLAVREVGHTPIAMTDAQLKEGIAAAQRQQEDERLTERLTKAALVVVGHVLKTEPFESAQQRTPRTEHDPVWWLAQVAIDSVMKGVVREKTVLVAFPTGADVMWASAPKFKPEQRGIFILALPKSLEETFAGARAPVYTAIDPLDFQSMREMSRIQSLVRSLPKN